MNITRAQIVRLVLLLGTSPDVGIDFGTDGELLVKVPGETKTHWFDREGNPSEPHNRVGIIEAALNPLVDDRNDGEIRRARRQEADGRKRRT